MFGLVIALHEQLRETESVRKPPVTANASVFQFTVVCGIFDSKGWFKYLLLDKYLLIRSFFKIRAAF